MTGSPEVVKMLQAALPMESHLNLQYRLDRESLKFMGIGKVADKIKKYAHESHGFRTAVNQQLLFLSGDAVASVSYQSAPVSEKPTVTAIFQNELSLEMALSSMYEQAIPIAMRAFDDETRNLYEHLIKWHHSHVRWLEKQLRLIKVLGEAEYITEQI